MDFCKCCDSDAQILLFHSYIADFTINSLTIKT